MNSVTASQACLRPHETHIMVVNIAIVRLYVRACAHDMAHWKNQVDAISERLGSPEMAGKCHAPSGVSPRGMRVKRGPRHGAKRQPLGGASSPVCPHDAPRIIHPGQCGRNAGASGISGSC